MAALAACLFLVVLPLGGGALGATSFGANGDIIFSRAGTIQRLHSNTLTAITAGVDPSWSPDGTRLAFALTSGGAIETCTATSCAVPTQLGTATGSEPVWSPDGTRIAYDNGANIHVITYPGGVDSILVAGADPTWSPDGTKLAFTSGGSIVSCSISSCVPGTALAGGSQPAWSPDGFTIAFQSGGNIDIVPASGGVAPSVVTAGSSPNWSPDGDSIVLVDVSGEIAVVEPFPGSTSSPRTAGPADAGPDWQTVPPVNVAGPSIFGTAQTGSRLSASNGTWNGAVSFTYRWMRCDSAGNNCSAISAATSSTYSPVSADVGSTLRIVVTATNAAGSTPSNPSAATSVVTQAGVVNPPSNTAPPTITLSLDKTVPMVGDFVSATAGSWSGSFPMTFTYQWSKCPAADPLNGPCYSITGATSSFFTVPASLYGMRFRVTVTATNSAGTAHQSSAATEIVTAIKPRLTGTPPITGQIIVDQVLSVDTGIWEGSTPLTYAYEWRRCDPVGTLASCVVIPGATLNTYIPTVADIGFSLRVYMTATNVVGSGFGITNHTYPIIDKQHFAPSAKVPPSITGLSVEGGQLSAGTASFDGDAPITTNVAWQRCDATGARCRTIPSATKTVYTPTLADVGSTLRLAVAAKNAYGAIVALSDPTDPVKGQPPHRKGRRIVGTAKLHFLLGTPYDDVLIGGPGNETIDGNGGYDTIRAGSGNGVITVQGPGGSRIYGGRGSHTIYAANGYKDYVYCVGNHDKVFADAFDVVKKCSVIQITSLTPPASGTTPPPATPGPR